LAAAAAPVRHAFFSFRANLLVSTNAFVAPRRAPAFRDKRETAFEAAPYAKSKARGEIIEIVERSTGTKPVMLEDGQTG
jgi:hypothetical protein